MSWLPSDLTVGIRALVMTAVPLAALLVVFSLSVQLIGHAVLGFLVGQIQTLAFLILVFGGQGKVYLVRERGHLWNSRPSLWMLCSSTADIAIVSTLATNGIWMVALPFWLVGALLAAVMIYLFLVDYLKIAVFRRFALA